MRKTYGTATYTNFGCGFVRESVETHPLCLLNEVNGRVTLMVPESLRASLGAISWGITRAYSSILRNIRCLLPSSFHRYIYKFPFSLVTVTSEPEYRDFRWPLFFFDDLREVRLHRSCITRSIFPGSTVIRLFIILTDYCCSSWIALDINDIIDRSINQLDIYDCMLKVIVSLH